MRLGGRKEHFSFVSLCKRKKGGGKTDKVGGGNREKGASTRVMSKKKNVVIETKRYFHAEKAPFLLKRGKRGQKR